ncbi:hypothetical protein C8R45DRAFT_752329, partial [Mycena sanguinolenta]
LSHWRVKRDAYLTALTWREGTGDDGFASSVVCPDCRAQIPEYCCWDCFGDVLYCCTCVVQRHRENPLHRIEVRFAGFYAAIIDFQYQKWHNSYFVKTSLAFLGLRVQLGHCPHELCSAPEAVRTGFVALHTNGIHQVVVDFCGCERSEEAGPPKTQLLCAGWFPA